MNKPSANSSDEIILSPSAFQEIALEVDSHRRVETGGILLGAREENRWYVVAAIDPGPRSARRPAYFEYNHDYASHLANVVARRYRASIVLLGLWHRHPGSLDTFSSTDDSTHERWLRECQHPIISGLVNIDPTFRMTFFRVDAGVSYTRINFSVGAADFPAKFLELKDAKVITAALAKFPNSGRCEQTQESKERSEEQSPPRDETQRMTGKATVTSLSIPYNAIQELERTILAIGQLPSVGKYIDFLVIYREANIPDGPLLVAEDHRGELKMWMVGIQRLGTGCV
jgi:Prokaryotic homologs of the JAB domain